jgi:hypothetical protein
VLHPAALSERPYPPYPPNPYLPVDGVAADLFAPTFSYPSPAHIISPPLYDYSLPPITPPPMLPFVDQDRVWLPPPSPSPYGGYYPSPSPLPYPGYSMAYNQPQVYPHRPASAEPVPSELLYSPPSGLPVSVVQQPLLPTTTGSSPAAERVEGKGERASRITHHLRMSSRARSVSPLSHKYSLPIAEDQSSPPDENQPSPTQQRSPSQVGAVGNLSPILPGSPKSDVASPRPMPSPKQTYAVDPITHLSFSKSERVEALERIAAQTDAVNHDMSSSVPDLTLAKNKTLPAPPVPSQKPVRVFDPSVPLTDIFSPSQDSEPDMTPPTPTLAAVASKKATRAPPGQLGGLDALEARLLAEVGTRKAEQESTRPDVRSVLPITIPRPDAALDPAIDSAISSLSLPGLGADEGTLRLENDDCSAEPSDKGRPHEPEPEAKESSDELLHPSKESDKRARKKKSGRKNHSDVPKEKEQHHLRKMAQGRIAAWLGAIDPEAPPQVGTSSREESSVVGKRVTAEDVPTNRVQELELASMSSSGTATALDSNDTPKVMDAKPNPRSSGFMPIRPSGNSATPVSDSSSLHDGVRKVPLHLWPRPKLPTDSDVRYDVRSARGGRGGQVTAVAALWAAQATGKQPSTPLKAGPPAAKKLTQWNKALPTLSPLSQASAVNAHAPRTSLSTPGSLGDVTTKRAKLVKSSSVPAVLSSSLATPMLSSTASLAQPSPVASPKVMDLPPTIQENIDARSSGATDSKASPKKELAFGQARLRELIKKYQG